MSFVAATGGNALANSDSEGTKPVDASVNPNVSGARSVLEDGGYLELGIGLRTEQSERELFDADADLEITATAGVSISGAWRRKAFFVEGRFGSLDGASIGATAFANPKRTIDVLVAHIAPTSNINNDRKSVAETPDERRDEKLIARNSSFLSSGLRWREYRNNHLIQLSAVVDWENDNGVLASAHVGRQWQAGNWNIEGSVGLRWASEELSDFLYGINADEATDRFEQYNGNDGFFAEAGAAFSRPLSENWVFRANTQLRAVDDALSDSPLIGRHLGVIVDTAISYVF